MSKTNFSLPLFIAVFTRSAMSAEKSFEEFEALRKEVTSVFRKARLTLLRKVQECPEELEGRLDYLSATFELLDVEYEKFTLAVISGNVDELRGAKSHVNDYVLNELFCEYFCESDLVFFLCVSISSFFHFVPPGRI